MKIYISVFKETNNQSQIKTIQAGNFLKIIHKRYGLILDHCESPQFHMLLLLLKEHRDPSKKSKQWSSCSHLVWYRSHHYDVSIKITSIILYLTVHGSPEELWNIIGSKRCQKKRKYVGYTLLREFSQEYFFARGLWAVQNLVSTYACCTLYGFLLAAVYVFL